MGAFSNHFLRDNAKYALESSSMVCPYMSHPPLILCPPRPLAQVSREQLSALNCAFYGLFWGVINFFAPIPHPSPCFLNFSESNPLRLTHFQLPETTNKFNIKLKRKFTSSSQQEQNDSPEQRPLVKLPQVHSTSKNTLQIKSIQFHFSFPCSGSEYGPASACAFARAVKWAARACWTSGVSTGTPW